MPSDNHDIVLIMSVRPTEKTKRVPSPHGSRHQWALLAVGPSGVRSFALPAAGSVVLGRDPSVEVQLLCDAVSRKHARLEIRDEGVLVHDLNSTNGVVIAGHRIQEATLLRPGVVMQVGAHSAYLTPSTTVPAKETSVRAFDSGQEHLVCDERTRAIYELARRFAKGDLPLLILGETGSGKEVLANFIHRHSGRSNRPYLQVNCTALPENLIEAELFGYQKGAFTGATETKPGLFELADGGTLLLDEIGDLPMPQQAKLLRVLEQGSLRRLGALEDKKVNLRILAATNVSLEKAIEAGRFRADLYHRLSGAKLRLPPLRERPDDILKLASHFLRAATGKSAELGKEAKDLVLAYDWPGNVRELKNAMDRAQLLCDNGIVLPEHLPEELQLANPRIAIENAPKGRPKSSITEEMRELERERILEALAACDNNQTRAAEWLGMPRRTLVSRLAAYGISQPRK